MRELLLLNKGFYESFHIITTKLDLSKTNENFTIKKDEDQDEQPGKITYEITFKEMIAEEFGVPQYRRRVLIVGTMLKDKQKPLKYNEIGNLEKHFLNINDLRNKSTNQEDLFSNWFSPFRKYFARFNS